MGDDLDFIGKINIFEIITRFRLNNPAIIYTIVGLFFRRILARPIIEYALRF